MVYLKYVVRFQNIYRFFTYILFLTSNLIQLWSENILSIISVLKKTLRLFYGSACYLSWWLFHMYLKIRSILQLLFHKYQLGCWKVLFKCSISLLLNYWKKDITISSYNYRFICLFHYFCEFLFNVFQNSIIDTYTLKTVMCSLLITLFIIMK